MSMLFQEHLPSELPSNGGFKDAVSANGARHFQDQLEKISSKDKEIKKKLSALKGRQLRLLARLSILEGQQLPTTGVISAGKMEKYAFRHQGDRDVCSNTRTVKPSRRSTTTASDQKLISSETVARPSASNGMLVIFSAGLLV